MPLDAGTSWSGAGTCAPAAVVPYLRGQSGARATPRNRGRRAPWLLCPFAPERTYRRNLGRERRANRGARAQGFWYTAARVLLLLGMRQARVSRVRGWPRAPAQKRECYERRNGKERDSTIDQFKLLSDAHSAAHPENARSDCEFFSCLGTRLPPRLRPLCARLSRGLDTRRRFAEANGARSPKRSEERRANIEAGRPPRRHRGARKRKLNATFDTEQVRMHGPARCRRPPARCFLGPPSAPIPRAATIEISSARSTREREARTSVLTWKTTKAEEEEGEGGRRKRL